MIINVYNGNVDSCSDPLILILCYGFMTLKDQANFNPSASKMALSGNVILTAFSCVYH